MTWSGLYPSAGLVAWTPQWAPQFEEWAAVLAGALGEEWVIEHVGSTSVPGLAAKPVIDMAVRVPPGRLAEDAAEQFASIGWTAPRPLGDHDASFLVVDGVRHTIAHLFTAEQWPQAHVRLFADWLRTHPADRDRYQALKTGLVEGGAWSDGSYTTAKADFVLAIVNAARAARGWDAAVGPL